MVNILSAPDGVKPPNITVISSAIVLVMWADVGRQNSDTPPLFQLRFRQTSSTAIQKHVLITTITFNSNFFTCSYLNYYSSVVI